jgi:hypothetical protein
LRGPGLVASAVLALSGSLAAHAQARAAGDAVVRVAASARAQTPGVAARVSPGSSGSGLTLTNVQAKGRTVVATGSDGRLIVSYDDGRTWVAVRSPVEVNLRGVAYGGGRWVAVGDKGAAATSTDAVHWSAVELGSTAGFRAITYADGRWIAGGSLGTVLVSTDGARTWVPVPIDTQVPFWGATSRGSLSLLTGDQGEILSSSNGAAWRLTRAPVRIVPGTGKPAFLWQVGHGRPGFVAVGGAGVLAFSRDGDRWSAPAAALNQTLRGVAFGRGRYVAVGEDGQIGFSRDGRHWIIEAGMPTDEDLRGVAFTGDAFIAVGDFGIVLRSSDAVHWARVLDGSGHSLAAVVHGHRQFIAVGQGGRILRSRDGQCWRSAVSGTHRHLYGVAGGHEGFVAAGAKGVVLYSSDGRRWLRRRVPTDENLRTVAFLHGRWYVAGDQGVILTSRDTRAWSLRTSLAPYSMRAFAENDGKKVVVGAGIIAVRRARGSWAQSPAGEYHFQTGVARGGPLFAAVGHAGEILTSTGDAQWTPASIDTVKNLDTVAYGDGMWITAAMGLVATSPDARTWTLRPVPTRESIRSITYGSGRWIAVGDHGVILISHDGASWHPVSSDR